MPDYLSVTAEQLGRGSGVTVRRGGDMAWIARDMAEAMLAEITAKKTATMIVPVGPVDQFPVLAEMINTQRIDCRDVVLINMDEYLTDRDEWLPIEHPLSFRGYMNRKFYDLLDPALAPRHENRVFPHPRRCEQIQQIIDDRGGIDACFGGIGINGHIAFNEPPSPPEVPTRVLDLTPETRAINSNTVGGEISIIPHRAVTVGMREILGARKLRFYCNRPWQSEVARRVLHGPITPECPASFLRTHQDATLTVAEYVATPPDIRLR
jgi:glucosamine-6-phosphate deaminase